MIKGHCNCSDTRLVQQNGKCSLAWLKRSNYICSEADTADSLITHFEKKLLWIMHSKELVYLPTGVLLLAKFLSDNRIYPYYIHMQQKGKSLKSVSFFETFLFQTQSLFSQNSHCFPRMHQSGWTRYHSLGHLDITFECMSKGFILLLHFLPFSVKTCLTEKLSKLACTWLSIISDN